MGNIIARHVGVQATAQQTAALCPRLRRFQPQLFRRKQLRLHRLPRRGHLLLRLRPSLGPQPSVVPAAPQFGKGFGFKGVGKEGNYGVGIQPTFSVPPEEIPESLRPEIFVPPAEAAEPPAEEEYVPCPIMPTTEEIESWMQSSFRKLTDLSTKCPPEVGESVLWRGVNAGNHGYTTVEHFNGKVRGVQVENNELYIYID